MHGRPRGWTTILAAAALAALAACDTPSGPFVGGSGRRNVTAVIVTPEGASVQGGATLQFTARTVLASGDTTTGPVTWSATGGNISSGGLFTAGSTAGIFRVIARAANGVADSVGVTVTVPSTNPTLIAVVVSPPTATVAAGGTVQFSAAGRLSNGNTSGVNVSWTASGGLVSANGLYTAGAVTGGPFQVIATGPGGLADAATVTITAVGGP
ncbi:MAG TPA: hypothetical protein VHG93_12775 [Longimicrobium sp.]|nr:hypothetical protein [Longimicrobium sp.]